MTRTLMLGVNREDRVCLINRNTSHALALIFLCTILSAPARYLNLMQAVMMGLHEFTPMG